MAIHVTIGEAQTPLSELVAAAVRGDEVFLDKAGAPQVPLVSVAQRSDQERAATVERRMAALEMYSHLVPAGQMSSARDMKMTDAE